MQSIVTKSAELISRLAKSGLLQEAEDKGDTESSNIEQRRAWAAELAGIAAKRKKELPALAEAADKARRAELEAWDAATRAREASQAAMLRSVMAQSALEGREAQLKLLLEGFQHPIIPDHPWDEDMPAILRYLHDIDDQVSLMLETLRHACRATHERVDFNGWGREHLVDIYNTDDIAVARRKLIEIQDALRQSMHQAELDPPKQRAQADELLLAAENIVTPLFRGSPAEDIFQREKMRVLGFKNVAAVQKRSLALS